MLGVPQPLAVGQAGAAEEEPDSTQQTVSSWPYDSGWNAKIKQAQARYIYASSLAEDPRLCALCHADALTLAVLSSVALLR